MGESQHGATVVDPLGGDSIENRILINKDAIRDPEIGVHIR